MVRLVSIWSRGSDIYTCVRDKQGNKYIEKHDFRPYFYYECPNGRFRSIFGDKLCKKVLNDPSDVPTERSKFAKHFEADIPYVRRFLIDKNFKSDTTIPLRKLYIDIEVEIIGDTFADVKKADRKVTSVCLYDDFSGKYLNAYLSDRDHTEKEDNIVYVGFSNELKLLEFIKKFFLKIDPDVVLAWNVAFDMDYLRNRFKRLQMYFNCHRFDEFDLLEAYRVMFRHKSNRLREVAVREGLLDTDEAEYVEDIEKMRQKNVEDVELIVKLDKKLNLSDTFLELRDTTYLESSWKVFNNSVIIDSLFLRLAKERGVVLPSIPENVEIKSLQGALVLTPPSGIFDNVCLFDISSCYPNTIITFNMSPETLTEDDDDCYALSNGVKFKKQPRGIVPELCEMLLKRKYEVEEELKKLEVGSEEYRILDSERKRAKYLVNAVYGYLTKHKYGSVSRLYCYPVAASITHMAREYLLTAKAYLEGRGFRVLYGDTDGLFVQCKFDKAKQLCDDLNEYITDYLKQRYGVEESRIRFVFSEFYKKILFTGVAKKYAVHMTWKKGVECDVIKLTGFERGDNMEIIDIIQDKVIEYLLRGEPQKALDYYKEMLSKIHELNPDLIAIRKGLNKHPEDYKNNNPVARGALFANRYLGKHFVAGSKPKMLYVKSVNGIRTDVVCYETVRDFKEIEIDYDKHIRLIRSAIKPLLDLAFLDGLSRWM